MPVKFCIQFTQGATQAIITSAKPPFILDISWMGLICVLWADDSFTWLIFRIA